MAIVLQVKDYCSYCLDFEADVVKPERVFLHGDDCLTSESFQTSTIVRCVYAKRCENIRRYLEKQSNRED